MDVVRGEMVEAELNRLIEKRAALEDPAAKEELWVVYGDEGGGASYERL